MFCLAPRDLAACAAGWEFPTADSGRISGRDGWEFPTLRRFSGSSTPVNQKILARIADSLILTPAVAVQAPNRKNRVCDVEQGQQRQARRRT
jgi:hypothetical protein